MSINGFPAPIQNVIVQQNYLNTKFERALKPTYVFRQSAKIDWFQGRIGETKTFTRAAMIPPNITPLNPASNTGLDNGISLDARSFEQWNASLLEFPGGLNLNVLENQTLLSDLFIDNLEKLAQKAGNSMELVAGQRMLAAYDSGDTFATVAITGTATTLSVDNTNGFTTQYLSANAYGLPQPVSTSNKLAILVLNGTTGAVKAHANVQSVAVDGTNTSYMQSGVLVCGNSGVLTLDAAIGPVAIGDRVVAMDPSGSTTTFNATYKDGSYVVRPLSSGTMIGSAYQMTASNTIAPSVQIPQAVSLLKRRGIPPLRNGLYGCAIDSTLLSYFYSDSGFQVATQGSWDKSRVFENGIIAKGWGVEFTEATQLPVYLAPQGGVSLRHAVVFGEDAITEHPFAGARDARDQVAGIGDLVDVRWVDRIQFINQAPLDRLNENVKMSYKFVGDFQPGTDKGANPSIVLTSDYCRYKRAVIIQASSSV